MKQFNDILDVARTLNLGEKLCSSNHWAKVSRILNEQEKAAASYDAKTVVESNFRTKRRIVLENAVKFVEAFKWRFDNEVIAPISTNEIGLQVAMGCEDNRNPRKIIKNNIDNLVILGVLKLESDTYSYDRSISKLYSFNQLVYDRLLDYASSRYQISLSQYNDSLSYHISNLCGKKKVWKAQKPDDSDIPDEPMVNPLVEKLEKKLDLAVKSGLMGLFTANRISEELRLGRTWTPKDQPTGFCYSREAGELLKDFNDNMPEYRKALRIED